jgi:glycosyltransferase involved in cell wall biosynthesis
VPAEQIEQVNRGADLVFVPSRWAREVYLDCGVEVPVHVLPHGVDPDAFRPIERERETLTFGTFGTPSPRKGIDVLLDAFVAEFAPEEPARLLLKAVRPDHGYDCDDPRVRWVEGLFDDARLLELLGEIDVFVLPSRGEGFGLTGLEAMATGLPLIATGWSGPTEYLAEADSLPLGYRLVDCGGVYSNGVHYQGSWAEPDVDHLRGLMRWCFEHRDEARAMGLRAAERVRREFTWDRAARIVTHELDALAAT